MILLLDENLPIKLKTYFSDEWTVYTIREMKWSSIKNGKLLQLMEDNQFDALITMDKNLLYQHNLDKHKISIIVLYAVNNKLPTLQPFIELLNEKLPNIKGEKYIVIDVK